MCRTGHIVVQLCRLFGADIDIERREIFCHDGSRILDDTDTQLQSLCSWCKFFLEGGIRMSENVAPSNTQTLSKQHLLEKIEAGSRFLLYTEDPYTYAVKKQGIFLWYKPDQNLGAFYWGPVGKKEASSRRRIKLKNMTSIMIGKQTKGFQSRVAANAPSSRCFSFIGLKQTLNLQAPDEATLQSWVEAINQILTSAGREVTSEEVESEEGGKPDERERRYSVSVNGKLVNEQPAQPVDVAKMTPDEIVDWMTKGLSFHNYSLNKSNGALIEKKTVFLFYSPQGGGSLCWQGSTGQQYILPLHAISDIFVGKQTKVLMHKAAETLDAARCFSIIGPNVMLNLEAQTPQILQAWLSGIKHLVTRSGKDVVEDMQAENNNGGSSEGARRMSFMAKDASGGNETINQVSKGTKFTSYTEQAAAMIQMFASADGKIKACKEGETKAFMTFKVNEISDIFIGKQTNVFKSAVAEKAVRENCFSIKTAAGDLHLEASAKAHIDLWLKAVKVLLSNSGKDVVDAEEKQAGRRYSFVKKQEIMTRELAGMNKGQPVMRFTAAKSYQATLFMRSGTLYLVPGNVKDIVGAEEKIRLKKMTDIFVGKQTSVMKSPIAAAADANCCFSFVSKKATIDCAFSQREHGEMFLTGIRQVLSGTGKKVLLEDGKKAAPQQGGQRRYSIVGNQAQSEGKGSNAERVAMLTKGENFTMYQLNKTGGVDKSEVTLFLNVAKGSIGTLYWCPVGRKVERSAQSLPLDRIEEVLVGKQSATLTNIGAALAEEEQSFTLMGHREEHGVDVKVELDIESKSVEILSTWLEAISTLVSSYGMEVQVEGEDGTAATGAAAQNKDNGRRFSIIDKGAKPDTKVNTQNGKDCVQMMVRGKMAVMYKLDRQRVAQPKSVFVFFNPAQSKLGVLYWCEPGSREEIRKQSIAFHRITDLFVGRPTEMANAANIDDRRCFSIVTKHRSINFEVASPQDVDKWVSGINHVLTSSGMKMKESKENVEAEATGATPAAAAPTAAAPAAAVGSDKSAPPPAKPAHRRSETRRRFSFVAREHLNSVSKEYKLPSNLPVNPIEAMKKMANRRQTLISTDNQETVQMMRDGRVFIGYADAGDKEFVKKLLLVFYEPSTKAGESGRLYWCNPGTRSKSPFACLPLDEISDVFIGKHSEVLKSAVAESADARKTFSLIGKHQTIDLEAKTEEELTAFLFGIQSIMATAGLKAEEMNEGSQEAGGAYKRRYSIISSKTPGPQEHSGSWVAVCGLSPLGSAIAAKFSKSVVEKSSEVEKCFVWDANVSLAAEHEKKHQSKSVKQLAELSAADVIFMVLPAKELQTTIQGLKKVLKPQTIVVDLTSGDPALTKSIGTSLAVMGVKLLDAPIAGGVAAVMDAKAAVMVGGPAKDHLRVRPLFELIARRVSHVGPLGSGHAVKAVNNAIAAAHLLAATEGLAALSKMGVDLSAALAVVNSSSGRSVLTETIIPEHVLSRKFASGYSLTRMESDVTTGAKLVAEMLPNSRSNLLTSTAPLVQHAAQTLDLEADYTELVKVVEESANLELES
eukprot:g73504.t1